MATRLLTTLVLAGALAAAAPVRAQSSCADCHGADPKAPGHLIEWENSPHGRSGVGCERCHGGNASSFEAFVAHQEMARSGDAASPVAPAHVATTCGKCHVGPFVEFQKSRHYELVTSGHTRAPSCTTCHESVAAHLLSPGALAKACAECHKKDGPEAGRAYPAQARTLLESIRAVRTDLDVAKSQIRRVKDKAARAAFEAEYGQAQVPLVEAAQSAHAFVFDGSQERLSVSRKRTDALLDRLANAR